MSGNHWFGNPWNPACNEPEDRIATPVGMECMYCGKQIGPLDQGFLVPLVRLDKPATMEAQHLDCFLKRILPHGPDCVHCRGRDNRNEHKMSCAYRKHGGNCECWRMWVDWRDPEQDNDRGELEQ